MKKTCSKTPIKKAIGPFVAICFLCLALMPLAFHGDKVVDGSGYSRERLTIPGHSEMICIDAHVAKADREEDLYYEEGKPVTPHLKTLIQRAARRYDIDAALIKAVIMAESSYDTKARSPKGAVGLMQLMPKTAASLGVDDVYDPANNINAGVKYLRQLLDRFEGDVRMALAAYNAGLTHVIRHQGIPPIKATQAYLKKVMGYYHFYKKRHREQERISGDTEKA